MTLLIRKSEKFLDKVQVDHLLQYGSEKINTQKIPKRQLQEKRWLVRITVTRTATETLYNPYKYRW